MGLKFIKIKESETASALRLGLKRPLYCLALTQIYKIIRLNNLYKNNPGKYNPTNQ
jgi:hypothetical protein